MNYLGIETEKLKKITHNLNILLATYQIYYQNLRSFHWHVRGNHFFELHQLFEDLYNQANGTIDEIAERILTLKHKPLGSMTEYISLSQIPEAKDQLKDEQMLEVILQNHLSLFKLIRESIQECSKVGDEGSIDMLSSILLYLEKQSWMIDTFLENNRVNKTLRGAN